MPVRVTLSPGDVATEGVVADGSMPDMDWCSVAASGPAGLGGIGFSLCGDEGFFVVGDAGFDFIVTPAIPGMVDMS